jgi:hypothetical protein
VDLVVSFLGVPGLVVAVPVVHFHSVGFLVAVEFAATFGRGRSTTTSSLPLQMSLWDVLSCFTLFWGLLVRDGTTCRSEGPSSAKRKRKK